MRDTSKELYAFRISYGLLMIIYSANKCTDDAYSPNNGIFFDFRDRIPPAIQSIFEAFPFYTRSDLYWRIHCPLMLLAASGIAFGYSHLSRLSCLAFSLCKGVLLLLDQTRYNNHEYLYSTLALMICLIDCHDVKEYSLPYCLIERRDVISRVFVLCLITSLLYLMLNNAVYGIPGVSGLCGVSLMLFSLVFLVGNSRAPEKTSTSSSSSTNMWLQRFYLQLFVGAVYFYAGMAKTDTDWLSGNTARELLSRWSMDAGSSSSLAQLVVQRTSSLLSISEEQFYVLFAYCGLVLDITALPGLIMPVQAIRVFYTTVIVCFHVANHFLFILETFPFVMISTCMLYHDDSWINSVASSVRRIADSMESTVPTLIKCCSQGFVIAGRCWQSVVKPLLLTSVLLLHLLVPLRCALHTPFDLGTIAWSTSCQYFQWRMMTRSVRTVASHLRFVHPVTGESQIVTLDMLGLNLCPHGGQEASQQGSVCPDMREFLLATPQYEDRLYRIIRDARQRAVSPEDEARGLVMPPRVYADVWLEINGPPIQRFIDPTIDIGGRESLSSGGVVSTPAAWSYNTSCHPPPPVADWVMPRLEEFRSLEWIKRMQNITNTERTKQMRRWRKSGFNESDVIFKSKTFEVVYVADVPSSGESYFYFYRTARVQLLQGKAFLASQGHIDSSGAGEHLMQGIFKWYAVGSQDESCTLKECLSVSDAVLWKIVLSEGADQFDIKPFDDGRIKSVK